MAFVFSGCPPFPSPQPFSVIPAKKIVPSSGTKHRLQERYKSGMCWVFGDLGGVLCVLLAGGFGRLLEDMISMYYLCEFQKTLTYAHAICVMVPFNYSRGNSQPKVVSLIS